MRQTLACKKWDPRKIKNAERIPVGKYVIKQKVCKFKFVNTTKLACMKNDAQRNLLRPERFFYKPKGRR